MASQVHRRTALLAALAFGAAAARLSAQQAVGVGMIEGTVREAGTGRPLEGVQVGVTGANIGAATNGRGTYRIQERARADCGAAHSPRRFTPGHSLGDRRRRPGQDGRLRSPAVGLQLEAVVTTGTGGAVEVKKLGNTVGTIEPPKYAPIKTPSELLQGKEPGSSAFHRAA